MKMPVSPVPTHATAPIQALSHAEPVANTAIAGAATSPYANSPRQLAQRQQLDHLQSANHGLPRQLKAGIEALSGLDMSGVRVHRNSAKPAQLQAHAYAQGMDIHLGPGQEKHLGHEAWHVVQQMQGRVKPDIQAKMAGNINTDIALEREADLFGQKAMQFSLDPGAVQLKSSISSSNIIQCKGKFPLMTQLNPLLGWVGLKMGDARNYDPHLKPLFKKINEYDRSKDGRPRAQYHALVAMLADLHAWSLANAAGLTIPDIEKQNRLFEILFDEREIVDKQARRLEKYSHNADSPYEQMTDEGMLWSLPEYGHSTTKLGKTGKAYFEELSSMNMQSIESEIGGNQLRDKDWFPTFVKAASNALSNSVVNHYTTSFRARSMLDGGGMKSKIMLEKDLPTFKHNTSIYDDIGLGNSGFLFFFIESPNAPLRGTRFAEGDDGADPARISIPIQQSGLLSQGWIMLSDFAQREYPDIMTNEHGAQHTSTLPTRVDEHLQKHPAFKTKTRHFELGQGNFGEDDISAMMEIKDSEKRQAFTATLPQAKGDKGSQQVYSGPHNQTLKIPDHLFNNVLVGKDIIPGLAHRAGLEVARIRHVNLGLGQNLSQLRGDALMTFILKDSFRPQAMIPNSLKLEERYLQPNPKLDNIKLNQMTDEIIVLGEQLRETEPNIMAVIDKEMTEIMYLGSKKLEAQVARMEQFLSLLKQKLGDHPASKKSPHPMSGHEV